MERVISRWSFSSALDTEDVGLRSPIAEIERRVSSLANGYLTVFGSEGTWQIHLENGRIVYAANSIAPFDRLDLHLRRMSHRVSILVAETRAQLRRMFEPANALADRHRSDYDAICWLVKQRYLSSAEGATLVEGLIQEVMESLLLCPEARCEFVSQMENVPRFCHVNWAELLGVCQQRIEKWQALAPHICSPYQRPYLFSQSQAQQKLSSRLQQRLASLLKGHSFRQLSALMDQDELKLAEGLLPYIVDGTVLLRSPKPPFDRLPSIPSATIALTPVSNSPQPEAKTVPALLKATAAPALVPGSPSAREPQPMPITYTIACIDDSPSILREMRRFLDDETFDVHVIDDPLKALIRVIRLRPDLILLDIGMPNIDGYRICRLLRNHTLFCNTPIVMVTGNTSLIDRAKARFAGASDYLTKPFTRSQLLEVVFRHLS